MLIINLLYKNRLITTVLIRGFSYGGMVDGGWSAGAWVLYFINNVWCTSLSFALANTLENLFMDLFLAAKLQHSLNQKMFGSTHLFGFS